MILLFLYIKTDDITVSYNTLKQMILLFLYIKTDDITVSLH